MKAFAKECGNLDSQSKVSTSLNEWSKTIVEIITTAPKFTNFQDKLFCSDYGLSLANATQCSG